MEGAVSDAKTALGSEQLNCLKALTALRIAYFNQKRLLHWETCFFFYYFVALKTCFSSLVVLTLDLFVQGKMRVGTNCPLRWTPITRKRSPPLLPPAAVRLNATVLKWSVQQSSPSSIIRLGRWLRRHSSRISVDIFNILDFLPLTLLRRTRRSLVRATKNRKLWNEICYWIKRIRVTHRNLRGNNCP